MNDQHTRNKTMISQWKNKLEQCPRRSALCKKKSANDIKITESISIGMQSIAQCLDYYLLINECAKCKKKFNRFLLEDV